MTKIVQHPQSQTLKHDEHDYERELSALRAALRAGARSGVFDGDAFASVSRELGLPGSTE